MGKLFKTKKEREQRKRKERRRAFRQAENAVEDVKDRIKQMDKDAQKQWEEAREALKSGQKAAANRMLTGYRAAQVMMTKLEQKRWVFEQYLSKMETAQSDNEFSEALEAVNKVVNINPEQVADIFEASQDILGEQQDADRFWNKLYEKEMDGAAGSLEDYIPSVDELSQELESEAGAEVSGEGSQESANDELDERISSGRERVKDMLNEKSQQ